MNLLGGLALVYPKDRILQGACVRLRVDLGFRTTSPRNLHESEKTGISMILWDKIQLNLHAGKGSCGASTPATSVTTIRSAAGAAISAC